MKSLTIYFANNSHAFVSNGMFSVGQTFHETKGNGKFKLVVCLSQRIWFEIVEDVYIDVGE